MVLTLASLDRSDGQVFETLALVNAAAGATLWSMSPSPFGTNGSIIDGALTVGPDSTQLVHIRQGSGRLAISDRDSPTALNIGTYYSSGGAGNNLRLTVQDDTAVATMPIAGNIPSSGGNFVQFQMTTDVQAIIDRVSVSGGRLIIGLWRVPPAPTVTIETPENTEVEAGETLALMATATNPGTIAWTSSLGTFADASVEDAVWTAPEPALIDRMPMLTITVTNMTGSATADVTIDVPATPPPPPATPSGTVSRYTVKITRDGMPVQYAGQDATSWVKSPMKFRRGRDYGSQEFGRSVAGRATLVMFDDDEEWSSILQHRDKVQISKVTGSKDPVPLWTGFIDDIDPNYLAPGRTELTLRCKGYLLYLTRNDIFVEPRRGVYVGDSLRHVLRLGGVPDELIGELDNSVQMRAWWVQAEEPMDAARALETTAVGFMFEQADGPIALQSLTSRINAGVGTELPGIQHVNIKRTGQRDFVAFEGRHTFLGTTGDTVLWSINDESPVLPLDIPAGETANVTAVVPNREAQTGILGIASLTPFDNDDYIATGAFHLPGEEEASAVTVSRTGEGVQFALRNPHANSLRVLQLQIRGRAYREQDGALVRRAAGETDEFTAWKQIPRNYFSTVQEMESYIDFLVKLGARGQPIGNAVWYQDNMPDLNVDLSTVIHVPSGRNQGSYFVEGIEHEVWLGGQHKMKLTLAETTPYLNVMIWDSTDRWDSDRIWL